MSAAWRLSLTLFALLGPGATHALAQGCAMCGTALKDDPLGRAFGWSVLFLIAAPYSVVALLGGYIFYAYWRPAARRRGSVIDLFKTGRLARRPGGENS
jgi:predicted MFS family arabinose efflux permease